MTEVPSVFSMAVSLFFVLNVLGNIPLFLGLLGKYDIKKQRRIMIREMVFALIILFIFMFFGQSVLNALGITSDILRIGGGFLLLIIALGMLFPKKETGEDVSYEPMVVPLAIPGIAGPGSIASVMMFASIESSTMYWWHVPLAAVLAWIPSVAILLGASYLKYILGEKGLVAFEKLGGMIVSLIGVQMIATGIIGLVKCNFPDLA